MDVTSPPSVDCMLLAPAAVIGMLSFALLGCSLRRMSSQDRLTVAVWLTSSSVSVAGGWWAAWTLCLMAVVAPDGSAALHLAPGGLAVLAATAACGVLGLNLSARAQLPAPLRLGIRVLAFGAAWAGMFECARRAGATPLPAHGSEFGLPTPLPSLALACGAAALSFWLQMSTPKGVPVARPAPRGGTRRLGAARRLLIGARRLARRQPTAMIWYGALVLGLGNAAAAALALRGLHWPAAVAGASSLGAVSPALLAFTCAIATLLVAIGLVCAWLDAHGHARTRELEQSLNEANRRLREQALSDPLTRMPNRLMFEERLEDALARAGTQPCSLAVLFIDLDGFKPINDSFGHVAGDSVLREIGRRLQAVARPEDTVARVGGDEFLLMSVRPGHEAVAASIAQRVLATLGDPLLLPNQVAVNLSASIGIVMYPEHGPAAKLIANADAAMYAAKRAGGSTYAFFEPRMELDAREQLALHHELRHAIDNGELELYYQPKIDGRSGQVTGVESLLRWQHAVRGFVPPDRFIPIAERFGLIGTIGNWVIDQACRQLRDWTRMGLRMRIAVNLSVHQLRQEDLVQRVRLAVEHFGVDPQLLTFEITESVAMEDTQETMKAFSQLASVGVSLSIDDFGTGYSSLSYLRKLPARQLKIDRSFVQDLGSSQDALAVVDAVIKLAHALGLRVVAEGVETPRQRDILLALQCDELQGYLFAKPMAAKMLTLWAMGDGSRPGAHAQRRHEGHQDFRPSLYMDEDADTEPLGLQ